MRTDYPKPIVAAVPGYAVGGGLELLLSCDIIIAAEHAEFGLPEVKRGLLAGVGATELPRRIPLGVAMEMMMTGERITAERAHHVGLVNAVRPSDDLLPTASDLAGTIAQNGPAAVRATKALVRGSLDRPRRQAHERAEGLLVEVNSSPEAREGAQAFVDKRAPRWSGSY